MQSLKEMFMFTLFVALLIIPNWVSSKEISSKRLAHANVVIVQERLLSMNFYRGSVDGILSKDTIMAIKRYQSARGLKVTGVIDRDLSLSLNIGDVPPAELQRTKMIRIMCYSSERLVFDRTYKDEDIIVTATIHGYDLLMKNGDKNIVSGACQLYRFMK